jgi:SnoaL-like protein
VIGRKRDPLVHRDHLTFGGQCAIIVHMDEATVRAMLEQHLASSDPDLAHEMYHDDAVLEFPQSGERFVGVENFREWRSNYPASTSVEFREIRGRDDLWVAEISIRYEQGPWNLGVSILELRGDKIARESIYVTEGWEAPEWRAQWRSEA